MAAAEAKSCALAVTKVDVEAKLFAAREVRGGRSFPVGPPQAHMSPLTAAAARALHPLLCHRHYL